jgi:hypothetical protein
MTRAEVQGLFGKPTGMVGPAESPPNSDSLANAAAAGFVGFLFESLDEFWEYEPPDYGPGDQRKAEFLKKLETLPEDEKRELMEKHFKEVLKGILCGPSDEAFVVCFDLQGYVKGLRAPSTGPFATFTSAGDYPKSRKAEAISPSSHKP